MPANHLPRNQSLEQLRKRAKEIRDLVRTGHFKFTRLARELHPRWKDAPDAATEWARFTLADAQLVIARGYTATVIVILSTVDPRRLRIRDGRCDPAPKQDISGRIRCGSASLAAADATDGD